jgi:hypothetical protein
VRCLRTILLHERLDKCDVRRARTHTHTSTHKHTTCKNLCVRNKLYNLTEQADVYIWRSVRKKLCIVLRTTYLRLYKICKNLGSHSDIFWGAVYCDVTPWPSTRKWWLFECIMVFRNVNSDSETYAKNVTLHKICYLILWEKCSSELRKMICRH